MVYFPTSYMINLGWTDVLPVYLSVYGYDTAMEIGVV
jgi:hypothetical protein